ncbi:MAG: hypothetical protein WBO93_13775 [Gammaproteobacteria bacterium]
MRAKASACQRRASMQNSGERFFNGLHNPLAAAGHGFLFITLQQRDSGAGEFCKSVCR